jgi:hypothetical protein
MMKNIEDGVLKRAVIAGADFAMKVKRKNPSYSEEDVLEEVVKNSKTIIKEIDKD